MGQPREPVLAFLPKQWIRLGIVLTLQQITTAITGIDNIGPVILHHGNHQRGAHPGHGRICLGFCIDLPMGCMQRMHHQLQVVLFSRMSNI